MKPWLEPTHHGVYSRLLRRLLIGDDLAVAVPADESRRGCEPGFVPTPTASARTSASAFAGTCASRSPHDGGAGALSAAFYCVADSRYFLGAVGLVNSLRLVGHREPIYLLDCGLDDEQRRLLEPEVTLVGAPEHAPPTLLKTIVPFAHPADVMVLIDTDLIVTRRLEEPIAEPARGGVVAFRNDTERHVPEWGELLDLGRCERSPTSASPSWHSIARWEPRSYGCSPSARRESTSSAPTGASAGSPTTRCCTQTRTC